MFPSHIFFHTNLHLKYQTFPKAIQLATPQVDPLQKPSEEIASFFSEFNARDKPISSILDLLSKILVNWFYKLNENSITDSNFSASLPSWKAIQHQQNKNSPLCRRNFRERENLYIIQCFYLVLHTKNMPFGSRMQWSY